MSNKHKNETAMAEEHSGLAEPRNALRQIRHLEQQQENVHREKGIDLLRACLKVNCDLVETSRLRSYLSI